MKLSTTASISGRVDKSLVRYPFSESRQWMASLSGSIGPHGPWYPHMKVHPSASVSSMSPAFFT